MNERIQELDKQAVDYALSVCDANGVYQGKEYLSVVKEKFAELIVRQMLDITDAHTEVFQTDRDRALVEHIKQSVKQHLGVEE